MHSLEQTLHLDQRLKQIIQQKDALPGHLRRPPGPPRGKRRVPRRPRPRPHPRQSRPLPGPQSSRRSAGTASTGGFVYFVNSYYAQLENPEHLWYEADYHGPFCAALRHHNISAFQFHPEKSGEFGQQLLLDWLQASHQGLCRRIIPCLDVANGRTVKGIKFQNLRDVGDPIQLGRAYQQQGADELMFLDISASHQRRTTMLEWVRREWLPNSPFPFAVGGGVNSLEGVLELLALRGRQSLPQHRRRRTPRAAHRHRPTSAARNAAWWPSTPAKKDDGWEVLTPRRPPPRPAWTPSNGAARSPNEEPAKSCSPPGTRTAPAAALTSN
jgi:hypothetical protein